MPHVVVVDRVAAATRTSARTSARTASTRSAARAATAVEPTGVLQRPQTSATARQTRPNSGAVQTRPSSGARDARPATGAQEARFSPAASSANARVALPCVLPFAQAASNAARGLEPRLNAHPRSRRGFTLVELMGVILILSLMATIITVNWRAILPKTQLHSAVRTLAGTLASTRSEAIARSAVFHVQYDIDNQRYRVITPFRLGGGFAFNEEDRQALSWNLLPDSVRFAKINCGEESYTQGMVNVRFDALGSATGHSIVVVQLPFNNLFTIEVQGLLGLIDYKEGEVVRLPPKDSDFE